MNGRIILAIVRKDVAEAIKNRYILFALLLPIAMSLLLRLAFPTPEEMSTLKVAIYDPAGSRLVTRLQEQEQPRVELIQVDFEEKLTEVVKEEAVGGLAMPARFDAALAAGEQPTLTIYLDSRRGGGGLDIFQRLVERLVWELTGNEFPAKIVTTDVGGPPGMGPGESFRFDRYILILMWVIALSMAGAFMVPHLLVEEKEKHTLAALLLSPAGPADVVAGKAITGMVYGLLTSGVLLVLNRGWEGNWAVTVLALFMGTLLIVLIGLLMGSFFRTTMQVNTWTGLIMLLLMMPSWLSVIDIPASLETAVKIVPTHYVVDMVNLSLAGESTLAQIWVDLVVLGGGIVLLFAGIVWVLRQQER